MEECFPSTDLSFSVKKKKKKEVSGKKKELQSQDPFLTHYC